MAKMQNEVTVRRMAVMTWFKDHDRLKNHHITKPQFVRCMPFLLTENELEVICRKYTDGEERDGINYY
jgi:hypothetical protein